MATSRPINQPMSLVQWGMLVALSVLWGASFFFNGVTIKALPAFTIVLLRVGLASAFLFALTRAMGLAMPTAGRIWAPLFCMGLLNNALPFTLIVWGQGHVPSGLASVLNATTTLSAVVIAHFATADEKITPNCLAGVLVGLGGVATIVGPEALGGIGTDLVAQLSVLAGAISYAFAGVYGRRFRGMGVPPIVTATGQLAAATVIIAPMALVVDQPWTLPAPSGTMVLAVLGLALSTALSYVLYFRILASAGATNLLLVTFLVPVSAIVLGMVVLGERLNARQFLGMALIGLGLAAVDGRFLKRLRERFAVAGGATPGPGKTERDI